MFKSDFVLGRLIFQLPNNSIYVIGIFLLRRISKNKYYWRVSSSNISLSLLLFAYSSASQKFSFGGTLNAETRGASQLSPKLCARYTPPLPFRLPHQLTERPLAKKIIAARTELLETYNPIGHFCPKNLLLSSWDLLIISSTSV